MALESVFPLGLFFDHGLDFVLVKEDSSAQLFRRLAVTDGAKVKDLHHIISILAVKHKGS